MRAPERGDGPGMARVHVRAWKTAYRGLIPSTFLDSLDEEHGGRAWEHRLAGGWTSEVDPYDHELLVVETAGGPDQSRHAERAPVARSTGVEVVGNRDRSARSGGRSGRPDGVPPAGGDDAEIIGIATVGPDRCSPGGDIGELWMINVRPDAWGSGAASRLLDAAQRKLNDLGYLSAILWVIADNARARRFYERHGWRSDGVEKRQVIGGGLVRELRYSFCEPPTTPG